MAKRAAANEQPYNPIDRALINAAVNKAQPEPEPSQESQASRVVSMPAAQVAQPQESRLAGPDGRAVGGHRVPAEPHQAEHFLRPAVEEHVRQTAQHMPEPHTDGRSRLSPSDPNERFQDRRIPLSAGEDAELERLITAFATELGCKVKGTHVGRGLFGLFVDAYDHLLDRARRAPRIKRPGNGDPIGLMKFEQHVREVIEGGLRDYLTRGRGHR